jgi:hypothetical protein
LAFASGTPRSSSSSSPITSSATERVLENGALNRNTAFRGRVQINLVGTDAEAADRNQLFRRGNNSSVR